jgi:hypothetical protein
MERGNVSYKKIDSRCEVRVRELNRNKTARRLIAGARPKRGNAGLIVASPEPFEAGVLVEIDIKFPGQDATYRSRGIVDFVTKGAVEGTVDLAVAIFGIDKLDPNAPAPLPPRQPDAEVAVQNEEIADPIEPTAPASPPRGQRTVRLSSPPVDPSAASARQKTSAPPTSVAPTSVAPTSAAPSSPTEEAQKPAAPSESAFKLKLPDADDVGELLSGLVDGEVTASIDAGQSLATKRYAAVGEYVMDDGETGFLMVGDLKLINRLGAALVMLPKAESEAAIENNRISDEVRESFQEILNIATGLMNVQGNPHSRFQRLYLPGKENLPDPVTAIINRPGARVDFQIEVPGYGQGRICILDRFRIG